MAAVVFWLGDRPAISQVDALELAGLLAHRPNLPAFTAAGKIRTQAMKDTGRGETSSDVELDRLEMLELLSVLDEPSATDVSQAVERLHGELRTALAGP